MYEMQKIERDGTIHAFLEFLPKSNWDSARSKANELADLFEGQDMNAIGLLYRAAEAGKFEECVRRMQEYYTTEGQHITVENRSAARNQNIGILQDIFAKESEIANGTRPADHRKYWPREVQTLARNLGSVKMELFFASYFKEIMGK